ncbi:MAG: DUF397 domain-containing protein [Pseudonocardiaceae bacterium]|nr:DUF397 domain-containing protein [Pseudonocardiaceae bacterium]
MDTQATATWRKSSFSGGGNNCVEVRLSPAVGVRDSKNRTAGHLTVDAAEWTAFLSALKNN